MDEILLNRINRLTAWLAFLLMGVFVITGFGMVGMWGMDDILGAARSAYWHNNHYLAYLLIIVVVIHASICLYRTLRKHKIL